MTSREERRLAIFPDNWSVLVLERKTASRDQPCHPCHELPREEQLRDLGIVSPASALDFPGNSPVRGKGFFVDRQHLAPLVDRPFRTKEGERFLLISRRNAPDTMYPEECTIANQAFHLAYWDRSSRFCGTCAAPMEMIPDEMAKQCSACGATSYPRISPAVIVAVVRQGKLLLAHSHRHQGKMHSVLAGFVEAGETLEQAAAREVQEECGIAIKNIRYLASQPWPFPTALMAAFTAEYAGGEISLQDDEIVSADWFAPGEIPPEIPDAYSIARRLIERFVSDYGTPQDLQHLLRR
ncbi:NAD+ diphosphatase [Alkalispirochaeta americana]|uniref:NAD(+) diphosphatase n=1 Tax=Alkalispirochaeta americana TaxID=159291 RepID=A0A1N6QBB1_9SPIO|nr:NAD(+) diphosphatase [Alkalispirochaeta americana]SIQ13818.1 NAD+ diphosphatase [Alkalispirochaeta americana]